MSTLKRVMPALQVGEMERALRFYTQQLGFSIAWRSPGDGGAENCMLEAGPVAVLLSTSPHLGTPPCTPNCRSRSCSLKRASGHAR